MPLPTPKSGKAFLRREMTPRERALDELREAEAPLLRLTKSFKRKRSSKWIYICWRVGDALQAVQAAITGLERARGRSKCTCEKGLQRLGIHSSACPVLNGGSKK